MKTLTTFAARLATVDGLRNYDKAIALMWWLDRDRGTASPHSTSDLRTQLREHGLGSPSLSHLADALKRSPLCHKAQNGYQLNQKGVTHASAAYGHLCEGPTTVADETSYIPEAVYRGTRGYIERVCVQLNGCFHHGYYDAASVMLRRVAETLLIEAYENEGREQEIRDGDDNYKMLRDLIAHAAGNAGLALGRETKTALREIKAFGDRAAHNRRFTTRLRDLENLRGGFRVMFDELASLAGMR